MCIYGLCTRSGGVHSCEDTVEGVCSSFLGVVPEDVTGYLSERDGVFINSVEFFKSLSRCYGYGVLFVFLFCV